MSAIGPKQTSSFAPHMSAFGGKADMTVCGSPLSRSLLGVKRTWVGALHMSAFDPKQTTLERTIDLASNAKQLPIGQRNCPNNYDGMAAFFGGVSLQTFVEVT